MSSFRGAFFRAQAAENRRGDQVEGEEHQRLGGIAGFGERLAARGGGAQQRGDLVADCLTGGGDLRIGRIAPEIAEGAQVRQHTQLFAVRQEVMQ